MPPVDPFNATWYIMRNINILGYGRDAMLLPLIMLFTLALRNKTGDNTVDVFVLSSIVISAIINPFAPWVVLVLYIVGVLFKRKI